MNNPDIDSLPKLPKHRGIIEIKTTIFYEDGYVRAESKAQFVGLGKGMMSYTPSSAARVDALRKAKQSLDFLLATGDVGVA